MCQLNGACPARDCAQGSCDALQLEGTLSTRDGFRGASLTQGNSYERQHDAYEVKVLTCTRQSSGHTRRVNPIRPNPIKPSALHLLHTFECALCEHQLSAGDRLSWGLP